MLEKRTTIWQRDKGYLGNVHLKYFYFGMSYLIVLFSKHLS